MRLFYPFVGIHHYLYSPIADWAETLAIITSMLLIIPVWTVLVNFFGTVQGPMATSFGHNLPAKFLIMGSIMYLFGCFQGSTEALRAIQRPTHFIGLRDLTFASDRSSAHSSCGLSAACFMSGRGYAGRELWSFKLGNWSFWLITMRHLYHGPSAERPPACSKASSG